MNELKILLVDDEANMLMTYDTMLRLNGYSHLVTSMSPPQALELAKDFQPDVIVLDLMMGEYRGQDFIESFTVACPDVHILIVSALDTIEVAVECIRLGARDYLVKPLEQDNFLSLLKRLPVKKNMVKAAVNDEHMIYQSRVMQNIMAQMKILAPTPLPILITGETGTGKELMAKALHQESDVTGDLITINVAGLDESMFSDTLFGHEKGSFTGAQNKREGLIRKAESGTLFLDEIGDLDSKSQVKLLRLLQEGEFYAVGSDNLQTSTARIVVATHVDLASQVKAGRFRQDLYYRLCNHRIHCPALRERSEDIVLLAQKMNDRLSKDLQRPAIPIPPSVLESWSREPFPGNVRELEGKVREGILFGFKKSEDAFIEITTPTRAEENIVKMDDNFPTIKAMTNSLVDEAMRKCDNKQVEAAKLLGISQQALSARLKKK